MHATTAHILLTDVKISSGVSYSNSRQLWGLTNTLNQLQKTMQGIHTMGQKAKPQRKTFITQNRCILFPIQSYSSYLHPQEYHPAHPHFCSSWHTLTPFTEASSVFYLWRNTTIQKTQIDWTSYVKRMGITCRLRRLNRDWDDWTLNACVSKQQQQ